MTLAVELAALALIEREVLEAAATITGRREVEESARTATRLAFVFQCGGASRDGSERGGVEW